MTHDARKFFKLLLTKNGYVLEQLYSPLVVVTTAAHEELKSVVAVALRGITTTITGDSPRPSGGSLPGRARRVKPLLYVYRVLLTGIHLCGRARSKRTSCGSTRTPGFLSSMT